MRGLRGHPPPGPREALLLRRCRSIQTFGLRQTITVAFLDPRMEVLEVRRCPRWRIVSAGHRVRVTRWSAPTVGRPGSATDSAPQPEDRADDQAPIAAAHTSRRVTTHGAQLGSAAGSLRPRSGSIRPSHSRTTRTSRWGIRQLRANEGLSLSDLLPFPSPR